MPEPDFVGPPGLPGAVRPIDRGNPPARSSPAWERIPATWWVAVLLCATTIVLRWPVRTALLSHWDEVQYALGMHQFDVLSHQPQPPGSPFYLMLGRASFAMLGDDHQAFLLISVLASAGSVFGVYLLTFLSFGRRAAWLAAAGWITYPVFWAYGASGSAWTMAAFLASVVGICCLLLCRGARWLALPSGLVIGLASGFRLDVTVFLGPLWLWSLWRAEPRPLRRLLAVALAGLAVASWLVPVVWLSGGWLRWFEVYVSMFVQPAATPEAVLRKLAGNTLIVWGITLAALGPLLFLGLAWGRGQMFDLFRGPTGRSLLVFGALGAIPSFLFLWFVDATEAGHNLLYLVVLYPAAAGLAAHAAGTNARVLASCLLLVLVQATIFLFAAPLAHAPFTYTANTVLLRFTRSALQEHDRAITEVITAIRATHTPDQSLIVTLDGPETAFRFAMYYLPEYTVLRLHAGSDPRRALRASNWRSRRNPAGTRLGDASIHHALWLVRRGSPVRWVPTGAVRVPTRDHGISSLDIWDVPVPAKGIQYFGYRLGGV